MGCVRDYACNLYSVVGRLHSHVELHVPISYIDNRLWWPGFVIWEIISIRTFDSFDQFNPDADGHWGLGEL